MVAMTAKDGIKPVFGIAGIDFRLRPNGRPLMLAFGTAPPTALLMDWRLHVWSEGRDVLVFGGIHPDFIRPNAPFSPFFRVDGMAPTVVGILEAAVYVDFLIMDADGRIKDNFIWTFVQRELVSRKAMLSAGFVG